MNAAPLRAPAASAALAVLAVLTAGASSACDGAAPPAHTGGEPGSSGAGPAAGGARGVVPLSFEAKKSGSKPFPFAFVDGKVGDQPTRFLIDTGAGVHAIDASVAAAAKVGAPADAAVITIDGWGALPRHAVAVRELPPSIRAHGIGGVIAPQLLAEGGQAVVVDFINQKMRMSPKSTAWSAMDDVGTLLTPPAQRRPCASDADGIAGVGLAVDGAVDGEPMHLSIDSGASRTMLAEGSKGAAKATAHPVLGRSVAASASADVATSIYGGVPFTVGAWSSTVDVGVTAPNRQPQCGAEGRLGMDVLQQCALAMTAEEFLVACRAPGR